jgi:Cdc6-like AAA superfamily ATPase
MDYEAHKIPSRSGKSASQGSGENDFVNRYIDATRHDDTLLSNAPLETLAEMVNQSVEGGDPPPSRPDQRSADEAPEFGGESIDLSRNWAMLVGQGPTHVESVAQKDALAREAITDALVSLLRNRYSTEPLTIGLFGAWGSGKSSQVSFVKKRLEAHATGRPRIRVIEFNAWEHEKCDNLSAALAQTVVEQLIKDRSLLQQWKLARELAARKRAHIARAAEMDRVGLKAKLYQWVAPFVSWEVATALAIVIAVTQANWEWLAHLGHAYLEWVAKLGTSVAVVYLSGWKAVEKYVSGNLSNWFKRIAGGPGAGMFGLPDFAAKLGSFHEIRQTLQHLVSLQVGDEKDASKGDYLLIVVDDLDRCSVATIKLVLDAVRLVTSLPRVVTMVAVDDRIAYPAVESFFEQFKGSGRDASAVARDYLGKVFNVSISLPPVPEALAAKFIKERLFADEYRKEPPPGPGGDGTVDPPLKPDPEDPEIPDGTALVTGDEVTEFIRLAAATGISNPRALWRMKQAWYLLRNMALTFEPESSFGPWMRSLFVREAILALPAAARREIEAWAQVVQTGGTPPGLSAAVPYTLDALLYEDKSDVAKRWARADIVLLPAGACAVPEPKQQPVAA